MLSTGSGYAPHHCGTGLSTGDASTPSAVRSSLGLPDDQMAACPVCGSVWSVAAIRQSRMEELKGRTITCTPKDAADWTRWQTGRKVSRNRVTMWLKRGKLPSTVRAEEKGKWVFDTSELIACAWATVLDKAGLLRFN